jgi:hypothetical protein
MVFSFGPPRLGSQQFSSVGFNSDSVDRSSVYTAEWAVSFTAFSRAILAGTESLAHCRALLDNSASDARQLGERCSTQQSFGPAKEFQILGVQF